MNSAWVKHAISEINADYQRSADTHLIRLALPGFPGIQIYLKDESTHPTGSLKHRLARSLFLYGLCNGWIKEGTTIIEASSGSTAVSEAYFARLLGLPFIAVMPSCTAKRKIEQIEFYGSLSQIEKSDPRLFKCHKSFLINPENIIKLDKSTGTVYFENGGVCYVSKLKLKKLIERIGR